MTNTQTTYDKHRTGTAAELRKYQRWGLYLLGQKIEELEKEIRQAGGEVPVSNSEISLPAWYEEGV